MAMKRGDAREPGLPSLNDARAERRRALVMGKARMPGIPLHFWLWTAVGIGAFGIIYWRVAQGELEAARSKVMARQRAMAVALGPKLFPFRDKVEGWVRELRGPWTADHVTPGIDMERVTSGASVYLRLRLANTASAKDIRTAAKGSLRDGFTSCLFVGKSKPSVVTGPPCRTIGDCSPGLLCNEWNACTEPEQPYNMRLVYKTLRVLSSEWTDELHEVTSDLGLSAYDRDLGNVAKSDVPVTVQLLARAKYFTLVLDEDPSGGLPAEVPGLDETAEERVQRVAHFARVGIWDLASGDPILRVRAEAAADVVSVGKQAVMKEVSLGAQHRQANSCALALHVRDALASSAGAP
jgi:hypothetical protein